MPPDPRSKDASQASFDIASEVHRALSHATRLKLLYALGNDEASVGDLANILGIAQPAASRHLAVLHSARLIRRRRDGHRVLYRPASDRVVSLVSATLAVAGFRPLGPSDRYRQSPGEMGAG